MSRHRAAWMTVLATLLAPACSGQEAPRSGERVGTSTEPLVLSSPNAGVAAFVATGFESWSGILTGPACPAGGRIFAGHGSSASLFQADCSSAGSACNSNDSQLTDTTGKTIPIGYPVFDGQTSTCVIGNGSAPRYDTNLTDTSLIRSGQRILVEYAAVERQSGPSTSCGAMDIPGDFGWNFIRYSDDCGATFHNASQPGAAPTFPTSERPQGAGNLDFAYFAPDPHAGFIYAQGHSRNAGPDVGGTLTSVDGGTTWEAYPGATLPDGASELTVLDNGWVVAADSGAVLPNDNALGAVLGFHLSQDHGLSWKTVSPTTAASEPARVGMVSPGPFVDSAGQAQTAQMPGYVTGNIQRSLSISRVKTRAVGSGITLDRVAAVRVAFSRFDPATQTQFIRTALLELSYSLVFPSNISATLTLGPDIVAVNGGSVIRAQYSELADADAQDTDTALLYWAEGAGMGSAAKFQARFKVVTGNTYTTATYPLSTKNGGFGTFPFNVGCKPSDDDPNHFLGSDGYVHSLKQGKVANVHWLCSIGEMSRSWGIHGPDGFLWFFPTWNQGGGELHGNLIKVGSGN